jgi:hypothetical protein
MTPLHQPVAAEVVLIQFKVHNKRPGNLAVVVMEVQEEVLRLTRVLLGD